jgi:hypothetical protein
MIFDARVLSSKPKKRRKRKKESLFFRRSESVFELGERNNVSFKKRTIINFFFTKLALA